MLVSAALSFQGNNDPIKGEHKSSGAMRRITLAQGGRTTLPTPAIFEESWTRVRSYVYHA